MKKFLKFRKEFILLLVIIVLALFLRLYNLGSVPVGMADDEIREVYTAYSIAHTGRDLLGNFFPLVFKIDGFNNWGPVSIYLTSLFYKFLTLNIFTARLPYALFGISSIVFFYLVLKRLFNDQKIAIASSFALSVSMWHIQLSRLAIEYIIPFLIYTIGIYFFLKNNKKNNLIVVSMIFFFLAFYSYAATKLIYIPLILTLVWYKFGELTKKHILIISVAVLLTISSYGFFSITQNATEYGGVPLFFMDKQKTALDVELERRASNEPAVIKTLQHNKLTYWSNTFLKNYLEIFSPQYLFIGYERPGTISISDRGELYMIELPLLILGMLYLFNKRRKEFYFILCMLLISPIPSALGVGGQVWTSRSVFTLFGLYAFIGSGIYYLATKFKNQNYKYLVILIILIFYLYSVLSYLSQYYYNWSITGSKYYSKSTKDLVSEITYFKNDGKKVLVSGVRSIEVLQFAFYNKIDPKIVQEKIMKYPITLSNITFTQGCYINPNGNPYKLIPPDTVYISNVLCDYKIEPVSKIKTYQNEVMWNIYFK